ncbi:shikimate kinase [Paenibacillus roseipurpureus]|uniref:Shikimate kinase n=1 Tax=Paenibacillus roseopurpureus TaxID=2918901 RepID=A0AA96LU40_9BACL|nr:shikimate kinase [Paenibacillus sp. MBLB1832]WNR46526.1 shikimate kinase [Paenibacillus sp. MBLB1832]
MRVDNLVLVGFMGTGKSTVGKRLAERLEWKFRDSDAVLENDAKTSISELFRMKGEDYFRALETKTIARIMTGRHQVVATGGGAVLAEANRTSMMDNGLVIALQATAQTIIERVKKDTNRPLLQGNLEERVHTLIEQRKTAYDFAHIKIDTTSMSEDEIVESILLQAGLA